MQCRALQSECGKSGWLCPCRCMQHACSQQLVLCVQKPRHAPPLPAAIVPGDRSLHSKLCLPRLQVHMRPGKLPGALLKPRGISAMPGASTSWAVLLLLPNCIPLCIYKTLSLLICDHPCRRRGQLARLEQPSTAAVTAWSLIKLMQAFARRPARRMAAVTAPACAPLRGRAALPESARCVLFGGAGKKYW